VSDFCTFNERAAVLDAETKVNRCWDEWVDAGERKTKRWFRAMCSLWDAEAEYQGAVARLHVARCAARGLPRLEVVREVGDAGRDPGAGVFNG
jgi:hypothetical protein